MAPDSSPWLAATVKLMLYKANKVQADAAADCMTMASTHRCSSFRRAFATYLLVPVSSYSVLRNAYIQPIFSTRFRVSPDLRMNAVRKETSRESTLVIIRPRFSKPRIVQKFLWHATEKCSCSRSWVRSVKMTSVTIQPRHCFGEHTPAASTNYI